METTVSIKGNTVRVPAREIDGHTIVIEGGWLRTATIREEEWQEKLVEEPERLVSGLNDLRPRPDLFTFAQKLNDLKPRFTYPLEWDNLAVVPITTYEEWWEKLPQETRKNVRRAAKRGVVVRACELDDALVAGIKEIYDETPVRQGRRFWHYGKNVETIRRDNSSYLERSQFVGAFLGEELIGFLKMVYTGTTSSIMQIVSKNAHQDKRPGNALLAKSVEICVERGTAHFVYGQYVYGRNASSALTTYKQRNGFEQLLVPRYYLPLTARGRLALHCHAHRGLREMLPEPVESALVRLRAKFYQRQCAGN